MFEGLVNNAVLVSGGTKVSYKGPQTWDATVAANSSTGLQVSVVGDETSTIQWAAHYEILETV